MPRVNKRLRTFAMGEHVAIVIDPAIHHGMPHPRFQGQTGIITGMQGEVYKVEIYDGKKKKLLLCRPEHIKVVKT